jgi:hypothetical protein
MHGIVMNIIECRPEVSLGLHRSFKTVVPDFAATPIIGAIPFKGRAAMKLTKLVSQFLDTLGSHENMVMVRKYAPCIYA